MAVGIETGQLGGLRRIEAPDALVGLEVDLDPDGRPVVVDPLVGVRAEPVHVAIGSGDATIAEQPGEHVSGLGRVGEEVPHVVRLLMVGEGIGLLGVDEVGELQRIADEEDRSVVPDQVVVPVLRVELEGEATRVAHRVGRPPAPGHGGEAEEGLGLLADLTEEARPRPSGHICGDLEFAIGGRSVGVYDPLGDALAVEAGELLQQVLVLDEDGPAGAGRLAALVVSDRCARLGGQGRLCHGGTSTLVVERHSLTFAEQFQR